MPPPPNPNEAGGPLTEPGLSVRVWHPGRAAHTYLALRAVKFSRCPPPGDGEWVGLPMAPIGMLRVRRDLCSSFGGASEGRVDRPVREGKASHLEWSPDKGFIAFSDRAQGVFVMSGISPRSWRVGLANRPGFPSAMQCQDPSFLGHCRLQPQQPSETQRHRGLTDGFLRAGLSGRGSADPFGMRP